VFGERVVVKLALRVADESQEAQRDALHYTSNRWLPRFYYRGFARIGYQEFEVMVTSQLTSSLDKVMDSLIGVECTECVALYLEHILREVLCMLLFSYEQHGISFRDLHLAHVGVRRLPADLPLLARDRWVWNALTFGREVVGVTCLDLFGVEAVEQTGNLLDRNLKIFLYEFMASILRLSLPSWRTVSLGFAMAMNNYIEHEQSYRRSGMEALRVEAISMGVEIRGTIRDCFYPPVAPDTQFEHLTASEGSCAGL
jgi:hypothetical protein